MCCFVHLLIVRYAAKEQKRREFLLFHADDAIKWFTRDEWMNGVKGASERTRHFVCKNFSFASLRNLSLSFLCKWNEGWKREREGKKNICTSTSFNSWEGGRKQEFFITSTSFLLHFIPISTKFILEWNTFVKNSLFCCCRLVYTCCLLSWGSVSRTIFNRLEKFLVSNNNNNSAFLITFREKFCSR